MRKERYNTYDSYKIRRRVEVLRPYALFPQENERKGYAKRKCGGRGMGGKRGQYLSVNFPALTANTVGRPVTSRASAMARSLSEFTYRPD